MSKLQERVTATEGGRRLATILGPIIGALPGVIILVAVSTLGRISTVSSLVIIYGAIEGYHWAGKQPKFLGYAYIFLINVGMIFLGEWMSVWVEGVVTLTQEYGLEALWDAVCVVPVIIAENPDIQETIFVNAVLGIVLSIPAGFYLFWAARQKRKGRPANITGALVDNAAKELYVNSCKTDRDGSPCLVMTSFAKGLFGFLFVCGVLMMGIFVLVPSTWEGESIGMVVFLLVFSLACLVAGLYPFTVKFVLKEDALEVTRFFRCRRVSYAALHEGAQTAPPKWSRIGSLVLQTGDGPVKIRTLYMTGGDDFLTQLAQRADLVLPDRFNRNVPPVV